MGYLSIFIFIIFLLAYLRKRQTRNQEAVERNFWNLEYQANNTRRQDISGLSYITIPLDKFPIGIAKDDSLKNYEDTLTSLSGQKILNLGSQTNTDLKLKYGPANLAALTDYEQNFTTLCHTLISYASRLIELGHKKEAVTVLEYGISCGSDLSKNYLLLADLYLELGSSSKLDELLEKAATLDSLMKASITKQLEEKRAQVC